MAKPLIHFYDIESLDNLFTLANYKPDQDQIDLYYLCSTPAITEAIDLKDLTFVAHAKNKNFTGTINLLDLTTPEANIHLAKTFGLSTAGKDVNDPSKADSDKYKFKYRPVCDTDPEFNPTVHPYLMGYNSANYDTTMLAHYLSETFGPTVWREGGTIQPEAPKDIRKFNDYLFNGSYRGQKLIKSMPTALTLDMADKNPESDYQSDAWLIRKSMLMTGRHLDVARLNEKQSKVALKRLLGILGHQILESKAIGPHNPEITTLDQFYDLVAYNLSDVINLKALMDHSYYQGQFDLKQGLLATYPELIYDRENKDTYKPLVDPSQVRSDRLRIDSSSAQFATNTLCPYDHLEDTEVVDLLYPAKEIVQAYADQGIEIKQIDVLEEAKKFFYGLYQDPDLRREFDRIYNFYDQIRGQNFNNSKNYFNTYSVPTPVTDNPNGPNLPDLPHQPKKSSDYAKSNTFLNYYDADGKPTGCYVIFSIGGIHGAEYNKALYEQDYQDYLDQKALMEECKAQYYDPLDLRQAQPEGHPKGSFVSRTGQIIPYTKLIKPTTIKAMQAMSGPEERHKTLYRQPEPPVLYSYASKSGCELNKRYVYTTAAYVNHEDFKSYYPNLLRQTRAFWNPGLGNDRYGDIFYEKEHYGKLRKDPAYSSEERDHFSVLREGTKLILNSASGAGDSNFESPVRINNRIIAMRCIGQLFTWTIGQAQSYQGARIPSTNTDGLYSIMEEELNNQILAQEAQRINIEIEPEPLYLISKDSNTRLEMDIKTGDLVSTAGSGLAYYRGPNPLGSPTQPAIIDWALAEYMVYVTTSNLDPTLSQPFDRDLGTKILASAKSKFDPVKYLLMYQNVLASSTSSDSYVAALDDQDKLILLQLYNRVFLVKPDTPEANRIIKVAARKIPPATLKKRQNQGEPRVQSDPRAIHYFSLLGIKESDVPEDKEVKLTKVNAIDLDQRVLIINQSLYEQTDQTLNQIISSLDQEAYLNRLEETFNKNWKNPS